ncbi:ABC transporter permease [Croceitalea rosinachiae]|uniref:FtsX-like permease family protein n=1 Tax=Croceitalea rosinachiae TaxID=3075596 RepID=A0ABU3A8S4_9FLAO|nr:FtsX-like permease family protein [Croceitalea sp. F388]MDT0606359.1 FtsX-like permease family protein [Croceitalea sp. F388]
MLKNYLKVGFRNIMRNRTFSAINLLGLVLGMVCFLFIFLWIEDERKIDNFHSNNEHLYNVYYKVTSEGKIDGTYTGPTSYENERYAPLLEGVDEKVLGIEHLNFYTTGYELPWGYPETFEAGDKMYKLEGSRATKDFFKMFDYPIIAGNSETPLHDLNTIAISRKMAELFFKTPEQAVGKTITYENSLDLTVTAVFENITSKSSLRFDYLIDWESYAKARMLLASHNILTTVRIENAANPKEVALGINRYLQTKMNPNDQVKIEAKLAPFQDRYLVANFENAKPAGGRIDYLELFGGVALFILIIACVNYMNLSTARSVKRAKEVGVRKVVGSSKSHLIRQFLMESLLLSFFAVVVSIALTWLLLPYVNTLTGKQIDLPYVNPSYWFAVLGLVVITGFIAGSYPALFMSSLKPVQVLQGKLQFTGTSKWLRKGLTVFQFGLSILLLIGTLVVSRQTDYLQDSHLGYDRENLLYIRIEDELADAQKYALFKEEASKLSGVALVDRSSEAPHSMTFEVTDPINWQGKREGQSVGFKPKSVGFDFLKLMNLKVAEGRGFSRTIATDSSDAFMVNREAVKQMGLMNPLGKWISAWDKKGKIIGILEDYHTASLHEKIKPVVVDIKENLNFGVILIRTEAGRTREAIAGLESIYQKINPNRPFDFQFTDNEYRKMYESEQVIAKLSNIFSVLALLISCLGILGLAMFSAEQRIKEIGIRKVLGASTANIINLFSKDILRLIGFSFLITAPVGWYFMNSWLQNFAYQIELAWWIFGLAGLIAFVIAFLTIGSQSLKVAHTNPVKSLRSE